MVRSKHELPGTGNKPRGAGPVAQARSQRPSPAALFCSFSVFASRSPRSPGAKPAASPFRGASLTSGPLGKESAIRTGT
ncbi:hypothetical protein CapIbe_018407 [Capra ibex]